MWLGLLKHKTFEDCMYQWTLPSQGLLSQNVEAVFDVLRSVAARRVLALSPRGLNAGARVLSRYCT